MKRSLLIATAIVAACAFAQEKPNPQPRRMMPRMPMMMHQSGPWVARMLSSKTTLEKIGVADEALRDKIIAMIAPLKDKGDALDKKIRDIAFEQAEMTRALFDDKTRDPKPVMDKIGEVAKLRAEQARISVKAMLMLRENLSAEQLEKAKTVIFERGRERRRMRNGGAGGGEGRKPGMGDGEGRPHRRGGEGRRPGRGGEKRGPRNGDAGNGEAQNAAK